MRLYAKAVINYENINNFDTADEWNIRAGEENTLYFQLTNLNKNGLRFIPTVGSTVEVTFPSIDDDSIITVSAAQVDVQDGSLWKIDLSDTQIPSSGNVLFSVVSGGVTRKFSVLSLISVEHPGEDGGC